MSCTNPLIAFAPSDFRATYDKRYRIIGSYDKVSSFDKTILDEYHGELIKPVLLPCGKCVACRLAYSKEWATRLMLEAQSYPPGSCYFITLTYDDDYLTFKHTPTGSFPVLVPKDTQDWLKRLRKRIYPATVRYFLSGEYGTTTFRPHYHVCLFGFPIPDLIPVGHNFQNDLYYDSQLIKCTWNMGQVTIGDLTYNSASYVARYCTDKLNEAHQNFITENELTPEFCRMSRRPGLGSAFLAELDESDKIYLSDGQIAKYPRFFMKRLKDIDERTFQKISAKRFSSMLDTDLLVGSQTDKDKLSLFIDKDRILRKKIKALDREL